MRSEIRIPPAVLLRLVVVVKTKSNELLIKGRLTLWEAMLKKLARLSSLSYQDDIPENCVRIIIDDVILALPVEGFINISEEKNRLEKEKEKLILEKDKIKNRLENKGFLLKAPQEVVLADQEKCKNIEQNIQKIGSLISNLI